MNTNSLNWVNKEKSRFYKMTVEEKDDKINVLYAWGGCYSNRGGKKNFQVQNSEELKKRIQYMLKRRKSRGYELVETIH